MTTKITLAVSHGYPITTSLQVAEYFGKRHADVIRALETLECSDEFSQRNFALAEYLDAQGKPRKHYEITRDGFAFLGMGFTGKKAAIWKEKYIAAFNAMEAALKKEDDTTAFNKARTFSQITRQFHATVAALRKDHGLRQAYEMANAEAKTGHNIDLLNIWNIDLATLPGTKQRHETTGDSGLEKLLKIIAKASKYKDRKFTKALKAGKMPEGKLQAMMKQPVAKVRPLLEQAVNEGLVEKLDGHDYGLSCPVYVVLGGAA